MKKIIVLLLTVVMLLSLAACGSDVQKVTITRIGTHGVETETYYEVNGEKYSEELYNKLIDAGIRP